LCGWPIGAHGEGAVSFVYEQIEALSKNVDAVFVEFRFCSVGEALWRRATGRIKTRIQDLWPAGVRAFRFWTPRLSTRLTRRTLLEDIGRAGEDVLRRAVKEVGQIDLIHAHVVLPAGLLGAAMSKISGVPLILQEHSGPLEMHLDTEEKRSAVESVLKHASAIVAVGPTLRNQLSRLTCDAKITVIPNFVRTDLFTAHPRLASSSTIRLVTVASLNPIKGLDDLLDAVISIRGRGQDVSLVIVGDGPLRDRLSRRIEESGLASCVSLLGNLSRAQVAGQLTRADIYVCSSHLETFGLAPAEALSVGRPVVTTQCGGPELYVDESCGVVVPVAMPDMLAEGIRNVWSRLREFEPYVLHERIEGNFGETLFREKMLWLYDQHCNQVNE
jgi:glycosyltransferase involved in cell wall biosynthesis